MYNLLNLIDEFLCKLMSLSSEILVDSLVLKKNTIEVISFTKRYISKDSLEEFFNEKIAFLSKESSAKLGKALGYVIANDVVISFDAVHIKRAL